MTTQAEKLSQIPKAYNPGDVEERTYQFWIDKGYFTPRIDPEKKPFVIIMPPPNVTGALHLGHALTAATEDVLVRWHRMMGEPTLWLPSSDHAGIATQVVVEQELAREGKTRHELGREAFVQRVWDWVREYGRTITEQHKRLGTSCDWTRERFTLDEGPSRAVRTTFVNLYRKGLIYRGERIINWCPRCSTALSDLEVEHDEVQGNLYYIRYGLAEGDGHVTVATTRPETLLGDTAVAVNPEDQRFRHLFGKEAILPCLGRRIPVIQDPAVDPAFGTGSVKVTPAHDPVDFEIAQRQGLPAILVIGFDGKMTEDAGPRYQGMEPLQCREAIVRDLEQDGLLEKVEPYSHSVGHCHRCSTVVEPIAGKQWFVKMGPLAEKAAQAVRESRVKIVPERFVKVYLNWMDNIRDWCISRQLWWGHRIPVWYCSRCDHLTVSVDEPEACEGCASSEITQDPDVLDTWFSSGLWTHSTLGWPDDTEDLRYFYPTSVMETGYDILFFWVARMIMLGIENMGEIPFHTVYLHGLIRDQHGEKMSKVKGNVVDPLDAIAEYGTDALRFALTVGTAPGNDSRLTPAKLQASRNFANKLWNAARYVMSTIDADSANGWRSPLAEGSPPEDRWIISRLNKTIESVQRTMEGFRLGEAQEQIQDFLWGEYCDWYIEMAKIRLREMPNSPSPVPVLVHVLEGTLRLLHPFMPFITEELWRNLTDGLSDRTDLTDSIIVAPYPQADLNSYNDEAEGWADLVMGLVRGIRNVRAEKKVEASRRIKAVLFDGQEIGQAGQTFLETLALCSLEFQSPDADRPLHSVMMVVKNTEAYLPIAGLFDLDAEQKRLSKELEDVKGRIRHVRSRLDSQDFLSKAPEQVIERERRKLAEWREQENRIQERMAELG
ncbi:MAG: valine--tRNA ligase [Dehalococcoidia bacterium]